ncbi:DUF6760 family protein [Streptomyces sp. NPDC021098]|uniref:DUF6760 family protein n=1 Tax=unclassified Streptomyces TaxID=2593676 RepID=UPI00379DF186
MTYAAERIHEEVAYLAYHFHWGMGDILDLEHRDRSRYVEQATALVARASAEGSR